MDLDARRRAADASLAAAFGLVLDHVADQRGARARFGQADVIATGVDAAFFNPILVFDPATAADDVLRAVAWVEGRGLPVSIQVRDDVGPALRSRLEGSGLRTGAWAHPVMVLDPIPGPPPPPPPAGLTIRVGGAELFDDWHAALESGEVPRAVCGRSLLADPRVRVAAGYVDGEPVAGAAVIQLDRIVGVYAVGTRERARRRGFGRAVTWAAIEAGARAWNGTVAILQSSEMGQPVYAAMGFEVVSRYTQFQRPPG